MSSSSSSAAAQEKEKESARQRKRDSAAEQPPCKWRTRRAQEAYSSRLLDALRLVRAGGGAARGREVRDAAYRALAVSARGRSRWSRAVLARSRRRSALQLLRARRLLPRAPATSTSASQQQREAAAVGGSNKAQVLGRLVPGCRKLSLPALLAEVSDYIGALEMQVRVMSDLTRALAAAAESPSTSTS